MEDEASNSNANTSTNVDLHESDFQSTGRVGRRNALPDILNEDGTVSATDLPEKLSALTTNDPGESSSDATTSSTAKSSPSK